ncbi:MAG: nucleotide exchange factor GrpE, partial [Pseudomonadota bacterium]
MTEENMPQQEQETQNNPEIQADVAPSPAEEIAALKDMYLRAMAETENVRNRAKRETEETAKYATTKFARDMVNVMENLARASQSISQEARNTNETVKQVGEGIDMTISELAGIFERNGIKRVDPTGQKFDHNFHQAVAQIENGEVEVGTVLQVLQAGYV